MAFSHSFRTGPVVTLDVDLYIPNLITATLEHPHHDAFIAENYLNLTFNSSADMLSGFKELKRQIPELSSVRDSDCDKTVCIFTSNGASTIKLLQKLFSKPADEKSTNTQKVTVKTGMRAIIPNIVSAKLAIDEKNRLPKIDEVIVKFKTEELAEKFMEKGRCPGILARVPDDYTQIRFKSAFGRNVFEALPDLFINIRREELKAQEKFKLGGNTTETKAAEQSVTLASSPVRKV